LRSHVRVLSPPPSLIISQSDVGCISGTCVTIARSEDEYFSLLRHCKKNSRVFLQRYTYEDRSRVVCQHVGSMPGDIVSAAERQAAEGREGGSKAPQRRGLHDIELEMNQNSIKGRGRRRPKAQAVGGGGEGEAAAKKLPVISVSDDDDDRPLRPLKKSRGGEGQETRQTVYQFRGWVAAKDDFLAFMSRLQNFPSSKQVADV
jgi:hypothetical protein